MRKMATDSDGDRYVAERSVGDATVKVLPDTIQKVRRDGTAYWTQATYEVRGPDGEVGGIIIRNASGLYDVPDKAERMPLALAVNVALGLEAPPSPAPRRAAAGETRDLEAALTASLANARPGPEVHQEPHENWELRQGDRIMRHLALYGAEGADVQTMSAGMHDMPTTKIRAHLRKLAKADNGPVEETEPGKYRRRPTGPGQPG
jgi:hypothetical protein